VAGNEEGCGTVCVSLFDLSEGEGGAPEARRNSTAFRHTSVEMGQHLMSAYFCPHLMFNYGYLIEFVCLKIDLIGISYNWVY